MNNSKKGSIFITVIVLCALMILIAVSASNMLLQDVHMLRYLEHSAQARYLAEAGISHALAYIDIQGMDNIDVSTFSLTPPTGSGLNGTYTVTASNDASGGRMLLTSEGTAENVKRTVSAEIEDLSPSAMDYMMSAGTDMKLNADVALADYTGRVHANN